MKLKPKPRKSSPGKPRQVDDQSRELRQQQEMPTHSNINSHTTTATALAAVAATAETMRDASGPTGIWLAPQEHLL